MIAYRKENAEAIRAKCREAMRLRRAADPEHIARIKKESRERYPERTQERERASYGRRKARVLAKSKVYYERTGRAGHLRRKYGITVAEANAIRESQGNLCKLCDRPMSDGRMSATRWVIDHIETEAGPVVRGILHANCNAGIGYFSDSPSICRMAADYLKNYPKPK